MARKHLLPSTGAHKSLVKTRSFQLGFPLWVFPSQGKPKIIRRLFLIHKLAITKRDLVEKGYFEPAIFKLTL